MDIIYSKGMAEHVIQNPSTAFTGLVFESVGVAKDADMRFRDPHGHPIKLVMTREEARRVVRFLDRELAETKVEPAK